MKEYELTVGLEVHAELKTQTKMFCACKNDSDEKEPNVNVCPVCMGHPGTLPTINKQAVKSVIKIGHAVGGKIADFTEFDRKNYFYPDIPKGYQISQYKYPLVSGGQLHGVELTRIHLEEDTGTSVHDRGEFSLVNYNRASVPLMELVTEPVIKSAKQAREFAEELQLLLRTLDIAEANMEKGEMRVEANISVAPKGADKFGTKVEVKNLNSFKSAERAIEYEMARHIAAYEAGETIVQETRGFDENTGKTFSQRKKEDSHDYRYFPDPDLPKLYISQIPEFGEGNLRKEIPELPWEKRVRYSKDFGIKDEDIETFVRFDANEKDSVHSLVLSPFFEGVVNKVGKENAQIVANYITSDLFGMAKKGPTPYFVVNLYDSFKRINSESFTSLVNLLLEKKISSRGAKDILVMMYKDGGEPLALAEKNGLILSNDPEAVKKVAAEVVAANPTVVADIKSGKTNLIQFLVGQGMKAMKGAGDPATIKEELEKLLK